MSASVRIEDEAFSDRRYDRLAREAGLADADHARGKMAVLWRQCTLEQIHILPVDDVIGVLGERGVMALVAARLGTQTPDGVRIHGTRGRIEWLKRLRNNGKFGKLGGRPRKPSRVPEKPSRVSEIAQMETPPAPAPAPAPALPEDLASEVSDPGPPKPKKAPPPEAIHVAENIAKHVLALNPGSSKLRNEASRKRTVDDWADAIRLLHERDGQAWPLIADVWRWARADGFWADKILSGQNLRKHFDQLVVAMKRPAHANGRRPSPPQPQLLDLGAVPAVEEARRKGTP